jgi:ceramide glucosyltransferase
MIYLFYIFAAALIYLSYRSFAGGLAYLRYFRQELAKPPSDRQPFVTIVAPCRGVDDGMQENLDAVLQQDYPEMEVIFVIDDENDPAAAVIESAWREAEGRHVKLVVADKATHSAQKAENLREGVLHADERAEVFVFVDSDARPGPMWLRSLVDALQDPEVGAATGYRWFISRPWSLAGELRSVWNASVASALGPNTASNFCWGGSTAIRREVFERLDIRERWIRIVSDDFTVTHAVNEAGLKVKFVPAAMCASIGSCTFGELFAFTTRQMKITRVYMPRLWTASLIGSAIFVGVMTSAVVLLFAAEPGSFSFWAAAVTVGLVSLFSIGKAVSRLRAIKCAMPQVRAELASQAKWQYSLWALTPAIFLVNTIAARFSRTILWRGTRYEMVSANETRVHASGKISAVK